VAENADIEGTIEMLYFAAPELALLSSLHWPEAKTRAGRHLLGAYANA
jgi:hypothetical protein